MTAREYAKNLFVKWIDDDWLNQPIFDKLLWEALNGQRGVNAAGVFAINFTRWRKSMRDGDRLATDLELKAALIRMHRRRYVFIDEDTGEGLIRSRMRRDELDKQPNPMLGALRTLSVLDSPRFATVLLPELERMSMPEINSTTDKANKLRDTLKRAWVDARTHLETLSEGLSEPLPEPFGEDFPEGLPEPFSRPGEIEPFGKGYENPSVNPSVLGLGSVLGSGSISVGGYLGEGDARTEKSERPQLPKLENEPPPHCPKHMPNGTSQNCGPCGTYRKRHDAWEAKRDARDDAIREYRRQEIRDAIRQCDKCDDLGRIELAAGLADCPNHPRIKDIASA